MPRVGIVMGSDSDLPVMSKAADVLDKFGVDYEIAIISAHRSPDELYEWAKGAKDRGVKVIIAGAGMAAHLPGICAALFLFPVIGVPMYNAPTAGFDSLGSIVQMPPGVPVATVGLNGATNAGVLAVKMLAIGDEELEKKLRDYIDELRRKVTEKNLHLQEVGHKNY